MSKNKPQINTALSGGGLPFKGIINDYTIVIGDNVKVIEDKKSGTRVANFPFEFPDGTRGIAIICRVKDEMWKPSDSLKTINLSFK